MSDARNNMRFMSFPPAQKYSPVLFLKIKFMVVEGGSFFLL